MEKGYADNISFILEEEEGRAEALANDDASQADRASAYACVGWVIRDVMDTVVYDLPSDVGRVHYRLEVHRMMFSVEEDIHDMLVAETLRAVQNRLAALDYESAPAAV